MSLRSRLPLVFLVSLSLCFFVGLRFVVEMIELKCPNHTRVDCSICEVVCWMNNGCEFIFYYVYSCILCCLSVLFHLDATCGSMSFMWSCGICLGGIKMYGEKMSCKQIEQGAWPLVPQQDQGWWPKKRSWVPEWLNFSITNLGINYGRLKHLKFMYLKWHCCDLISCVPFKYMLITRIIMLLVNETFLCWWVDSSEHLHPWLLLVCLATEPAEEAAVMLRLAVWLHRHRTLSAIAAGGTGDFLGRLLVVLAHGL